MNAFFYVLSVHVCVCVSCGERSFPGRWRAVTVVVVLLLIVVVRKEQVLLCFFLVFFQFFPIFFTLNFAFVCAARLCLPMCVFVCISRERRMRERASSSAALPKLCARAVCVCEWDRLTVAPLLVNRHF